MLLDAMARHKRLSGTNKPPRRFVLHPAVLADLRREMVESPRRDRIWHYLEHRSDGALLFMSVPVIVDPNASMPKLITHDNIVMYL